VLALTSPKADDNHLTILLGIGFGQLINPHPLKVLGQNLAALSDAFYGDHKK
jgi:hypothetical protein